MPFDLPSIDTSSLGGLPPEVVAGVAAGIALALLACLVVLSFLRNRHPSLNAVEVNGMAHRPNGEESAVRLFYVVDEGRMAS